MAQLRRPLSASLPRWTHPLLSACDGIYAPYLQPLATRGQTITIPSQCSYVKTPYGPAIQTVANGTFNAFGPTFGGDQPSFNTTVGLTLGVIFSVDSLTTNGEGYWMPAVNSSHGLGMVGSGGSLVIRVAAADRLTSTTSISTDTWYAVVYQASNTYPYRIWINGNLDAETASSLANVNAAVARPIGGSAGTGRILGKVALWVNFGRYLQPKEARQWSDDPWQIFRQPRRVFKVAAAPSFVPAWAVAANTVISSGARAA